MCILESVLLFLNLILLLNLNLNLNAYKWIQKYYYINSSFSSPYANGHIMLNTPVLVRSLKLSNIEPSQYLDGWPPGNTGCCWLSFFSYFKRKFAFFGTIWVIKYILALFLVLGHLKIHGNWSKFEENPFSRGFVGSNESFREFLTVSERFREVSERFREVLRTGTVGWTERRVKVPKCPVKQTNNHNMSSETNKQT